MDDEPILVIDDDPETADVLVGALKGRGYAGARWVDNVFALPKFLEGNPSAAVINVHYERPGTLTATAPMRQMAPAIRTLVLCAPGLAATQAHA